MKKTDELFCRVTSWGGRQAYALGNGLVALVTLTGGGHIAEFRFADSSGRPSLSPLWVPPWKTIDPQNYQPKIHAARYGSPTKAGKLLSGIVGHNICLDYFGTPSLEEYNLGLSDHGEAPILKWRKTSLHASSQHVALTLAVRLPTAGLELHREIRLRKGESVVYFKETIRNERKADHFFHWVQHVTLGPPFLSAEETRVTLSGTRSKTFPHGYDEGKALLASDREFQWPVAPAVAGGSIDLARPLSQKGLGFVVGVLLDPRRELEFIAAQNSRHRLLIGYCFRRSDYPWVTVWEENQTIAGAPWKEKTRARGLEFGTTPLALPRREAFAMGTLFGTSTLCSIPARGQKTASYVAYLAHLPDGFEQVSDVQVGKGEILVSGSGAKDILRLPAGGLDQTGLLEKNEI